MPVNSALSGRVAVVTGASSGIGRAIAESLGAAGAHVVLCGRTEEPMRDSLKRIEDAGGSGSYELGDVTDTAFLPSLVEQVASDHGRLDIFVNNAGVAYLQGVLAGSVDTWRAMLDTNVLALLIGCKAAVQAMRDTGSTGRIVNVSSVAARETTSGVYGATKHAVNVISNTLRLELLDDPIQITTVMPGVVATNLARTLDPALIQSLVALAGVDAQVRPGERIDDEILERAQQALSEFIARPEDVAAAVLFVVTQPPGVHVAEVVVRPNKDLDLQIS